MPKPGKGQLRRASPTTRPQWLDGRRSHPPAWLARGLRGNSAGCCSGALSGRRAAGHDTHTNERGHPSPTLLQKAASGSLGSPTSPSPSTSPRRPVNANEATYGRTPAGVKNRGAVSTNPRPPSPLRILIAALMKPSLETRSEECRVHTSAHVAVTQEGFIRYTVYILSAGVKRTRTLSFKSLSGSCQVAHTGSWSYKCREACLRRTGPVP